MDNDFLSLRVAVAVPALQALITALFWGVAVLGVVSVARHVGLVDIPLWSVAVVVFPLVGVVTWWELLTDWRAALYGLQEETYQDTDPVILKPDPVRVELSSNGGRSMKYIDLPVTVDQMKELAAGVCEGYSFTESRWVGGNKVFSRGEFVQLRDALITRGCLSWKSERDNARGVELTRGGYALMRHFASMSEVPTLAAGGNPFSDYSLD